MRKTLLNIVIGICSGFLGAYFFEIGNRLEETSGSTLLTENKNPDAHFSDTNIHTSLKEDVSYDRQSDGVLPMDVSESFVEASEASTQSVVFIQTISEVEYRTGGWMDWFFEPRRSQQVSSGSGVIYSNNGYIVTNNHVIEDADRIKVIFGKQSLDAELIGSDPSTDLAVIKVNHTDLPAIKLGSSEDVKVGQWVLAVGNPFNLTSTVTAGIVSAKGRNINILKDKFPIESFIQTDAAINPGNSGGALVDKNGELIGINTAILSRTGSYAGYGFAVPVDLVKKVVTDLIKYGEVQKALIGADFIDIDGEMARKLNLPNPDGVLMSFIQKKWAADQAGLEEGDVILEVNGKEIDSKSTLEEMIGYLYPGDQLNITYKRDGKMKNTTLTLTNKEGTTGVIKRVIYDSEVLGVKLEAVPKVEKDLLGIKSGVRVVEIENGFFARLDIPEGFIVTEINNNTIDSPEELSEILEKIKGRVTIYGVTARGRKVYYPLFFR